MSKYHEYIFNTGKREFIGAFEEMYQKEQSDNFDSWHQEDSRQLNRKIALSILEVYNFHSIVDIGSGKGALTHLLKKRNNQVVGLDISHTAVEQAKARFPDIQFNSIDVNNSIGFRDFLEGFSKSGGVDLIFTSECLSYLSNWKEFIQVASKGARFLMISLFIPEDPIGFVKDAEELESEISKHYEVLESVHLTKSRFIVIFGKSRAV
jgi:cyclopropane fatty-acyl-phospholipid synthase-like methyltransferase